MQNLRGQEFSYRLNCEEGPGRPIPNVCCLSGQWCPVPVRLPFGAVGFMKAVLGVKPGCRWPEGGGAAVWAGH